VMDRSVDIGEGSGCSPDPNTMIPNGSCAACMDDIILSVQPLAEQHLHTQRRRRSRSSYLENLAIALPYGINLACPFNHAYCLSCFETFITGKLNDSLAGKQIFPIRCPACSPAFQWTLPDETIRAAISPKIFSDWTTQRFLDEIPKMYCPNPRCSEVIALPEEHCFIADSNCPRCKTSICVGCRTVSHPKLSCSLWQRSPLNPAISNPADLSLRRLAKRKHWRRCSKCRIVVERTEGCGHMTCRCGHQFCHLCGSDWTYSGCTNNASQKGCDGRTWRDDPTLHAPSRWKGMVKRTVLTVQKAPEKIAALGSKTKAKLSFRGLGGAGSSRRSGSDWKRRPDFLEDEMMEEDRSQPVVVALRSSTSTPASA